MIDGVHIWRAALDDPGWPGAHELPAGERERAAEFLREEPARRWVASRWALRRVLAGYLGCAPAAVELESSEQGKPRLRGSEGPEFNLSHSEGLALVAVADRAVGIDVEAIRPRRDLPALAERALPPDDVAAVRSASPAEQASVFHAAWARHEACLKCLGTGLGAKTSRQFPPSGVGNCRLAGERALAVEDLDVAPGYAAAVAVADEEVGPIVCRSLWAG